VLSATYLQQLLITVILFLEQRLQAYFNTNKWGEKKAPEKKLSLFGKECPI
jgi:hypothetical protein